MYETAVVVKKTDSGIRSAASEQEGSCKNRRDRADSKDSEGPSTGFAVAYDIIWHDGREVAAGDAKAKSGNRRTAVANCRCDFAKISSAHSRRDKIRNTFSFSEYALVDTFRIKGFVYLEDTWYLVNAVGNMLYIEPCSEKKETQKNILVILSGYGLPTKKAIRKAMEWYPEVVLKIE